MTFHGIDIDRAEKAIHLARTAVRANFEPVLGDLDEIDALVGYCMCHWTGPIRASLRVLCDTAGGHADALYRAIEGLRRVDECWSVSTAATGAPTIGAGSVQRFGFAAPGWVNGQLGHETDIRDWTADELVTEILRQLELPRSVWVGYDERALFSMLTELAERIDDPEMQRALLEHLVTADELPPILRQHWDAINLDSLVADPEVADEIIVELRTKYGDELPEHLQEVWEVAVANASHEVVLAELGHLEGPLLGASDEIASNPHALLDELGEDWTHRYLHLAGVVHDRALHSEELRSLLDQSWDEERLARLSRQANVLIHDALDKLDQLGRDTHLDDDGIPPISDKLGIHGFQDHQELLDAMGILIAAQLRSGELGEAALERVGKDSLLIAYVIEPHARALSVSNPDRQLHGLDNIAALTRGVWSPITPTDDPIAPILSQDRTADVAHMWLGIAGLDTSGRTAHRVMVDSHGEVTDAGRAIIDDNTFFTPGDDALYHDLVGDFITSALRAPRRTGDESLLTGGTRIVAAISAHDPDGLSPGALHAATAALDIYLPIIFAPGADGDWDWAPILDGKGNIVVVNGEQVQLDDFDRLLAQMALNADTRDQFFEQRRTFATYLAELGASSGGNVETWPFEQFLYMTNLLDAGIKRQEIIDAIDTYLGFDPRESQAIWQRFLEEASEKGVSAAKDWLKRQTHTLSDPLLNDINALEIVAIIGGEGAVKKIFGIDLEERELELPSLYRQSHEQELIIRAATISAIPVDTDELHDLTIFDDTGDDGHPGAKHSTLHDISLDTRIAALLLAEEYLNATDPDARQAAYEDLSDFFENPTSFVERKQSKLANAKDPGWIDQVVAGLDPQDIKNLLRWISSAAGAS